MRSGCYWPADSRRNYQGSLARATRARCTPLSAIAAAKSAFQYTPRSDVDASGSSGRKRFRQSWTRVRSCRGAMEAGSSLRSWKRVQLVYWPALCSARRLRSLPSLCGGSTRCRCRSCRHFYTGHDRGIEVLELLRPAVLTMGVLSIGRSCVLGCSTSVDDSA